MDECRGPWCLWWDVACDDLTDEERAPCKEEGLFCCPDECEYCAIAGRG